MTGEQQAYKQLVQIGEEKRALKGDTWMKEKKGGKEEKGKIIVKSGRRNIID